MALISKEDLLTKFETGALLFQPEVKRIIKIQPEVDAVQVIRCKECVHYTGHWYCEAWSNSPGFPAVKEDGFCNMAERRTDE